MSMQFRLPRPAVASRLKKCRGPIVAVLMAALVLVPSASSGSYTDPAGDSGAAGDITSVTVVGDKGSGALLFKITGTNLATSETNLLFLTIDSDANPLTGDLTDNGSDYWFGMDDSTYGFEHWDGSHWVDAPNLTVRITGGTSGIMVSINRSELGNTADFNFAASTINLSDRTSDHGPNDGVYNYSLEANGPQINSVDVQTKPSTGPRAGKRFVVVPTGLKLPPDGRAIGTPVLPESYSCTAKLGANQLAGSGTGGCTIAVPKKKARGKRLTVQLTVIYQGVTKVVPLTFKVT
ncbi:MAG TPA: hypothetical protein VIL73_08900 [Gaiellaceae bacterium]|jgi:hypothetical protein